MTNAEAMAIEERANAAGGARGSLIRRIALARMDIPGAVDAETVFRALDDVQEARRVASSTAEVSALLDQDDVSASDLARGIRVIEVAAREADRSDGRLSKLALDLKDKAGKTLLDQHLPAARAKVDDIVERAFRDHGVTRGSLMDPREVSAAITRMQDSLGGNAGASKQFLDTLLADGTYAGQADLARAMRSTSEKRKIDAGFHQWLRDKAMEADPNLRADTEAARQVGQEIVSLARQAAGITPRAAAQRASRHVRRGSKLRGVTSRSGWSAQEYDADMVQLMQVVGRMIPADASVTVGSLGDIQAAAGGRVRAGRGRSFHTDGKADGVARVSNTYICLAGHVSKRTLYHEIGHAIESLNPAANAAVARWLKGRIEGKDANRLSTLTGIRSYRRAEVAVKDDFVDPYVGKVYSPRRGIQPNEALAMGLERLADPVSAAHLAARDPDHLALVLSALQMEYQP